MGTTSKINKNQFYKLIKINKITIKKTWAQS